MTIARCAWYSRQCQPQLSNLVSKVLKHVFVLVTVIEYACIRRPLPLRGLLLLLLLCVGGCRTLQWLQLLRWGGLGACVPLALAAGFLPVTMEALQPCQPEMLQVLPTKAV